MFGTEVVGDDIAGSVGHACELPADVVVGQFRRHIVEVETYALVEHVVGHHVFVVDKHRSERMHETVDAAEVAVRLVEPYVYAVAAGIDLVAGLDLHKAEGIHRLVVFLTLAHEIGRGAGAVVDEGVGTHAAVEQVVGHKSVEGVVARCRVGGVLIAVIACGVGFQVVD